jgi:cytochrome c biogenesis protein CcdA/thiol-disulfide isomerase/thioredoxin
MILYLLAYFGGALTIISPCILPVLPFVFARADRPFLTNGLPMLVGMALMFAGVATLAALGGGWAVEANQYGRAFALVLLALFGLTLLFPSISDRAMQPLVRLGSRLSNRADAEGSGIGASLLLGVATGLLWAPCAGPILGLVLTGAALEGASATTTLLLVAYALGAATSLALALLVGGRLFRVMKKSLGAGEWVKRALGAAVLVAVAAIALGVDTTFLTRASIGSTNSVEQGLLDRFQQGERMQNAAQGNSLAVEGLMPPLTGANAWLNSPPLTREQLKGKVVLVDFWTYSCINCLRSIPYVRAWAEKYKDQGLVVIGVHAPEFAFEKDVSNVRSAIADLGIKYPVAIDNDRAIWRAFQNHYWPAHYFIDAQGRIRHHHYGEGNYAESERVIQALLAEVHPGVVSNTTVQVNAAGAEAAAGSDVHSPETYVGYERSQGLASPGGFVRDKSATYQPGADALNRWSLAGAWTIGAHSGVSAAPGAKIIYRFHARDLHLVLGATGKPVHFRVTIDGKAPGADHGVDVDPAGNGIVTGQRLYQLIRQKGAIADRTFQIEYLDPGVEAFAFTFG